MVDPVGEVGDAIRLLDEEYTAVGTGAGGFVLPTIRELPYGLTPSVAALDGLVST